MEKPIKIKHLAFSCYNENHSNAICQICEEKSIEYHYEGGLIYTDTPLFQNDISNLLADIEERKAILENSVNISLSEEQIAILEKALDMLADANIGLCHDYRSTGQLMAFNSNGGKVYATEECGNDENELDYALIKGKPTLIDSTRRGKTLYSFYCGGFVAKK